MKASPYQLPYDKIIYNYHLAKIISYSAQRKVGVQYLSIIAWITQNTAKSQYFAIALLSYLLIPGNDRQIQSANRAKFGSRSFRSIEHERVHDFHSKQFSC